MASLLRGLWAAYERNLASRPIPTQMATSCVLWALGDFMAQRIEYYEASVYGPGQCSTTSSSSSSSKAGQQLSGLQASGSTQQPAQPATQPAANPSSSFALDEHRLLLTSAFGAGFIGPVGHLWYEGIEKVCRKLVPTGGARFLATKVVLDSAIMGSVYVIAFFGFITMALEGTGVDGFLHKMKVDFVPTYLAELAFWPVVQTLNFSKVPVRHQLLVVNTFSLLDAAFISWVGNQSDWSTKVLQRLGWSQQ